MTLIFQQPENIESMLRMYLMQNWFSLSDEGIEYAIYDSYAICSFIHLDFLTEQVPDATTLLHFRHLLEENRIGGKRLRPHHHRDSSQCP